MSRIGMSAVWAVVLCLCVPYDSAQGSAPGAVKKAKNGPPVQLRYTRELIQNDNLIPTQNRTQAMRIEAETGQLPPEEERMLARKVGHGQDPRPKAKKKYTIRRY